MIILGGDLQTYHEDTINCDGTTTAVFTSRSCKIPISVLLGSPFMLSVGSSVYAKVAAINVIGPSDYSSLGNGAVISMSYKPDPPMNLQRDEVNTSKTQVAFTWSDGASNGGQPILDYRISSDQGSGNWVVIQTGITSKSLIVPDATSGSVYSFKIEARNIIGYSEYSQTLAVKAAIVPSAPVDVTTERQINNLIISWVAPSLNSLDDYGDAIIGYRVFIRTSVTSVYE